MSHEHDFNEHSTDAMFATILAEVRGIQTTMTEVRDEVKKTNGRVKTLEIWRTEVTAKTAVIASIVSGAIGITVAFLAK